MVQQKETSWSRINCRPLGNFFSFKEWMTRQKNPDSQFLAGTDIEYQYSKEPTNTYYVSLFLTLSKNLRLTAYILQIYMQTCHIILPYICIFHQLNFRIAKNVYVTFFFNYAELDFTTYKNANPNVTDCFDKFCTFYLGR